MKRHIEITGRMFLKVQSIVINCVLSSLHYRLEKNELFFNVQFALHHGG